MQLSTENVHRVERNSDRTGGPAPELEDEGRVGLVDTCGSQSQESVWQMSLTGTPSSWIWMALVAGFQQLGFGLHKPFLKYRGKERAAELHPPGPPVGMR